MRVLSVPVVPPPPLVPLDSPPLAGIAHGVGMLVPGVAGVVLLYELDQLLEPLVGECMTPCVPPLVAE